MKKIKLLAPILSIATLSSVVMPLVGCSCNKSKGETITPELINSSEGVEIKESNIVKGKESTITLTIPSGKEIETLEIKVGNKVLTKDDYTIDANNKITIKADSVTGEDITVKVILKGSSPEEKTLKTLTIKNEASKKSFEVGETFSSEGLVLLATYKDNTTEDITTGYTAKLGEQDLKNYVFKNTDKGTDKTVTITFKDKECTYKINVNDKTYSETVIIDDQGNEYVADMDTICATTGNIKSKDSNLDIPRNEFNYQVVLGKNTTTINDNFLYGCSVFNNGDADGVTTKPFIFPNSVTTIGSSFLQNCYKFNQQITFPNNTNFTTIGSNFLSSCKKFNNSDVENIATKQFSIPDSVTTIGENFLYYCEKFNQQITFPNNNAFETIENNFMQNCSIFNNGATVSESDKPLSIPTSVTQIKNAFCSSTAINQKINIPTSVTSIGNSFLENCQTYNQPTIIPGSAKTIGTNFLYGCTVYNSDITLNEGIETIKDGFLGVYFLGGVFNKNLKFPSTIKSLVAILQNQNNFGGKGSTTEPTIIDFSKIASAEYIGFILNTNSSYSAKNNYVKFLVPKNKKAEWEPVIKDKTKSTESWPEKWTIEEATE